MILKYFNMIGKSWDKKAANIYIFGMEKKKQWILGREAVLKFEKYREERYLACGIK